MLTNLKASGYEPEDVDQILLTHAHPDHVSGLVIDNQMTFPNATVYLKKTDYDFWVNIIPNLKRFIGAIHGEKTSASYSTAMTQLVLASPRCLTQPYDGTPRLSVGYETKKLFVWGDVLHDPGVQLTDLDIEIVLGKFDEKQVNTEISTAKKGCGTSR